MNVRKKYVWRIEDIKRWEGYERMPEVRLFKIHYIHMKISNSMKAMEIEQKC